MKKTLVVLVLVLLGTTAFSQVKSDYDKDTDFSKYKTYSFAGWQKNSDQQLNDFDKERIQSALKSEFDKRGMTLTEGDADAKIALYLVLDKKTSTTAYTDYMGGMGYGPRWGWGMGPGFGAATTTYNESDYTEGTLVVDMYDASDSKLIWQGVMTTIANEKPKKREKSIPKKIKKLMHQFPVPAK
ncbi:DUF4136 domain-containing protein [Limibacter armeniacum]|uniref:DUF4136 domain-containing protein n=1 Tax=Limibacter armeniacum TaxID=466084 RepID=UPI002FE681D5